MQIAWLLIFCWLVTTRTKVKLPILDGDRPRDLSWPCPSHVTRWVADTSNTTRQGIRSKVKMLKKKKNKLFKWAERQIWELRECQSEREQGKSGYGTQNGPFTPATPERVIRCNCSLSSSLALHCTLPRSQLNGGVAGQINQNSRQRSRRFPRSMRAVPNRPQRSHPFTKSLGSRRKTKCGIKHK